MCIRDRPLYAVRMENSFNLFVSAISSTEQRESDKNVFLDFTYLCKCSFHFRSKFIIETPTNDCVNVLFLKTILTISFSR